MESGKEPLSQSRPPAASRVAMWRTALPPFFAYSTLRHNRFSDLSGDRSRNRFRDKSPGQSKGPSLPFFIRSSGAIHRMKWTISAGSQTPALAIFEIGTILRQHVAGMYWLYSGKSAVTPEARVRLSQRPSARIRLERDLRDITHS